MIASNVVCQLCLRTEDDCRCERWQLRQARSALTRAQKECDNVLAACREAQADCRRLREVLTAVNAKNTNDECRPYHAWEPGGDNHLETLSCPVLIPAQWLRDLIADGRGEAQAERDALVERVRALVSKWRQAADDPDWDGTAEGETALNCADELARLLPPQQKGDGGP